MQSTYGVVWREGREPLGRGKLELRAGSLRLEGVAGSRYVAREIAFDDLALARVGRNPHDRIHGRPSLVLERRTGEPIAIATVAEPGVVGELADRLAGLQLGGVSRRTAVIVPLADGAGETVRDLLAAGPPFDLAELGLERHHVFVTPHEAVFVFEARSAVNVLEPLLADRALWESASAWREHLAGPPRIAECAYSWSRPEAGIDPALVPPGLRDGA